MLIMEPSALQLAKPLKGGLLRSGEIVGGEKAFAGGLEAAQAHFDPILSKMFHDTGTGEFQGLWLGCATNSSLTILF